jgi:hypothetical protein
VLGFQEPLRISEEDSITNNRSRYQSTANYYGFAKQFRIQRMFRWHIKVELQSTRANHNKCLQELDPIVKLNKEARIVQDEAHTQEQFAKMHEVEAEQRMRTLVSCSASIVLGSGSFPSGRSNTMLSCSFLTTFNTRRRSIR